MGLWYAEKLHFGQLPIVDADESKNCPASQTAEYGGQSAIRSFIEVHANESFTLKAAFSLLGIPGCENTGSVAVNPASCINN